MSHSIKAGKAPHINPVKGFNIHLLFFVLTVPVLWLAWYFSSSIYMWPVWNSLAWGIGILFHYLGVFVFSKSKSN